MSEMKPTQRIYDVMRDIKDGKYKLPSIQRSFVWEQDRIYRLLDSLMSDYPIGSFLVWKPEIHLKIRIKEFIPHFRTGDRPISEVEATQASPYLVLDGQQRLQSLYLAFFGSYDGNHLYFRLDSDLDAFESDLKYRFQFLTSEQVKENSHWVRPTDIVGSKIEDISEFVDEMFPADTEEVKKILKKNLGKFIRVFNMDEKIHLQTVEEDLPYNDVLEVFVRVNSGGMILTKSDLVFSTIVLRSPDMEREFIDTVEELNEGNEFDFNIDFIIKTSFVLFDKGAKYEVEKLRDQSYIDRLQNEFDEFRNSLLSTKEFLKTNCKILSKRFLKSDLALIPIVDFIFQQRHQHLPEGQSTQLRQYLYMSFFMRFYSYGAEGKLDVIHRKISGAGFPLSDISKYMAERTNITYEFSRNMLHDLDLVLNIIEDGVAEIPRKRGWSLEVDHVFSRNFLEGKGIPDELINNIGNLRLINKIRNILKSDKLPDEDIEFWGLEDSEVKRAFLLARDSFSEDAFKAFVSKRESLIFDKVVTFLGFRR